jgi:hypothetical protein
MGYVVFLVAFGAVLFVATIASCEVGRRLGRRRLAIDPGATGSPAIEGAVFALLGLLVAFTFSGAATRFDARKQLIIDETNAIGTAYLRVDVTPAAAQPALRSSFRSYVDARLAAYAALPDVDAAREHLDRSKQIQQELWQHAVAASADAPPSTAMLLLPAINAMFDIASTRTLTTAIHPPLTIFAMLAALGLVGSLLAGYGMAGTRRSWMHVLGFATAFAVTVFVILDLEYPRLGLIRVTTFDRALVELRQAMQ